MNVMEKAVKAQTGNERKGWICLLPPWRFPDLEEELLYLAYTQRQREGAVPRLLVTGFLLQTFFTFVPGERDLSFVYTSVVLAVLTNSILVTVYVYGRHMRPVLAHISWWLLWGQLLLSASRRCGDSYNELLGWAVVLQYFTISTLPFHHVVMTFYSTISLVAFLMIQYFNAAASESRLPDDFSFQQMTNGTLLVGATLLGGMAYAVGERQQRSSFQETKRSLRDKLAIEQQSKEQTSVALLLFAMLENRLKLVKQRKVVIWKSPF